MLPVLEMAASSGRPGNGMPFPFGRFLSGGCGPAPGPRAGRHRAGSIRTGIAHRLPAPDGRLVDEDG